jgi:hypothetical protein
MASSKAATVEEYLQELPEDRREVVSTVRDVILRNLPDGYSETMAWGMISYGIPLERYPTTYNGQPLGYAALAAQKNSYSLYLLGVYMDPEQEEALREAFRREGKKLDMGKSCIRFRKPADLPLDAIGELIAASTPEQFIARYEASRAQ